MKTAETTAAVSVPVATNTSSCTYMVGALVDMFTRIESYGAATPIIRLSLFPHT